MSGVTVKNYLRILSIDIDSTRTTQRRGGTPHHDIVQHNVPIDMRHLDNQRPRKMLELQTVVHGIRHHGHLQQLLMRRRVFPILVRLRQCERERAILIATLNKRCRIRCVIAPPPISYRNIQDRGSIIVQCNGPLHPIHPDAITRRPRRGKPVDLHFGGTTVGLGEDGKTLGTILLLTSHKKEGHPAQQRQTTTKEEQSTSHNHISFFTANVHKIPDIHSVPVENISYHTKYHGIIIDQPQSSSSIIHG